MIVSFATWSIFRTSYKGCSDFQFTPSFTLFFLPRVEAIHCSKAACFFQAFQQLHSAGSCMFVSFSILLMSLESVDLVRLGQSHFIIVYQYNNVVSMAVVDESMSVVSNNRRVWRQFCDLLPNRSVPSSITSFIFQLWGWNGINNSQILCVSHFNRLGYVSYCIYVHYVDHLYYISLYFNHHCISLYFQLVFPLSVLKQRLRHWP